MCLFDSFCTQEIDSTPPATMTSASPATMRCAASAIVCRPDEQNRFTVVPDVVTGQPARSAIWRAMLAPVAPSGFAQPITTSYTSPGSMPAREIACCTAWPPSVAPCVMLNEPFQLLQSGVRAVETITAEVMMVLSSGGCALCGSPPGFLSLNVLPSAASLASSGAGCQNSSAYSIGPPRYSGKP